MRKLFKNRRFVLIFSFGVALLILATWLIIRNGVRKRKANKVASLLDECSVNPNCNVDEKGNVIGGVTTGAAAAGEHLSSSEIRSWARMLVDDIWSVPSWTDSDLWDKYAKLGDKDFKAVGIAANQYIRDEKGDYWWGKKYTSFYELIEDEKGTYDFDDILSRLGKVGLI